MVWETFASLVGEVDASATVAFMDLGEPQFRPRLRDMVRLTMTKGLGSLMSMTIQS